MFNTMDKTSKHCLETIVLYSFCSLYTTQTLPAQSLVSAIVYLIFLLKTSFLFICTCFDTDNCSVCNCTCYFTLTPFCQDAKVHFTLKYFCHAVMTLPTEYILKKWCIPKFSPTRNFFFASKSCSVSINITFLLVKVLSLFYWSTILFLPASSFLYPSP